MTKTNRDKKVVAELVSNFSVQWRAEATKAIEFLYGKMDTGEGLQAALKSTEKRFPQVFNLQGIENILIEAAAYGYGLVPSKMTKAQIAAISVGVRKSWTGTGMTLSKKLHSSSLEMHKKVIEIVGKQIKNNETWREIAKSLFDGYSKGHVLNTQQIAGYMQDLRRLGAGNLANNRKALANINRLANKGAPNQALKAAYTKLLNAIKQGSDEAIKNALNVAVMEKSRYVAERIARTESARAWADGFIAETKGDPLIVAYKWTLSSRHPKFDQCDFYAKADLFGLGVGVFPKNKLPPIPAHPHCGCRLVEIFKGEIDPKKAKNKVADGGDNWLEKLSTARQKELLGVKGREDWLEGEDWRKHLKGWQGLDEPETRLKNLK